MFLKLFLLFTLSILTSAEEARESNSMQSNENQASDQQPTEVPPPANTKHKADKDSAPHRFSVAIPVTAHLLRRIPLNIYTTPVAKPEAHAYPKYEYGYSIEDHHTGDLHSHKEQRDGDSVYGQYILHEADGTIRIVTYYDNGDGFNAVIEKQGKSRA